MIFNSDNWAGAHPKISEHLHAHASGMSAAYGTSDIDKKVEAKFNEIFETECSVFFVATGTAANALSMTAMNRPGGVIFAHREAHVIEDECGALEYFTGGARLCPVDGDNGKMDLEELEDAIQRFPPAFIHGGQPMAITLTQGTEIGTAHSLDDITAMHDVADRHGLPLHMDGARFANALVHLGCSPADMTWRSGVDMVSFGGTKNGCWCAEALVVFDKDLTEAFHFYRKRAGQLFSKTRFIAAQFEAYLQDDLWLNLARHANQSAGQLADIINQSNRARLLWQPEINELFPVFKKADFDHLIESGMGAYAWNTPRFARKQVAKDEIIARFVTSFRTEQQELEQFKQLLASQ